MKMMPMDLKLAVHVSPGDTFECSRVLLARASFNGKFELLTAAWERVLGYGRDEFASKTLRELMRSGETAAAHLVAAILDQRCMEAVELTVHSRAGEAKFLRLHRRLDAYSNRMVILAEQDPAPAMRAGRQTMPRRGPILENAL
jgi:hypothetical protein